MQQDEKMTGPADSPPGRPSSPGTSFATNLRSLAHAQKTSKGVSLYSRFLNRPVGRVIAAAAHRVGISANAMTSISAVVTTVGIALLVVVEPSIGSGVGAAALLVMGFACDSADGQISRLAGTQSRLGEWFDHLVDAGKMVAIHAGVLIGVYRFQDVSDSWLLVPIAYQLVSVVTFSGLTVAGLLKRLSPGRPGTGRPSTMRSIALLPADYGLLALSFVTWGAPALFRDVYVVLLILNALILLAFLVKWSSELRESEQVALVRDP